MVIGSSKTPSSAHSESFLSDGRPANSWRAGQYVVEHMWPGETHIENASYKCFLMVIERDTAGGFDVRILNIDVRTAFISRSGSVFSEQPGMRNYPKPYFVIDDLERF